MFNKIFYERLLLLTFTVLFCVQSSALAQSPEQKALTRQNILYYDLSCEAVRDSAESNQNGINSNIVSADVRNVYMVGDSITVRAKDEIKKQLRAKGADSVVINASTNRSITRPGETPGFPTSGIEAVEGDKAKINNSDAIIVALGTNQRDSNFKNSIKNIIGKFDDSAKIYWVNVFSKGGSNGYNRIDREKINQEIEQQSRELDFTVIDTGVEDIPLQDSVHQKIPEGNVMLADLIANQIFSEKPNKRNSGNAGTNDPCACGGSDSGTTAGKLSPNIPEPWRSIIEKASKNQEVVNAKSDPNIVAATLWTENRGWPNINKEWAVSSAGAKGPWQFIDSTWNSLGRDGDGDGIKDPTNPKDAAISAFLHSKNSLNKPIANTGFDSGNGADENWKTVVFDRNQNNLLSFVGSYNGDDGSSVEGGKIKDFPRGQNGDYVQMGYWLLATDFVYAWDPASQKKIDAKSAGGSSVSAGPSEGKDCSSATGEATGQFAWPDDSRKDPLTSCFGARSSPGGIGSTNHMGIDIGSGTGKNVTAADGGIVEAAGGDTNNTITIKHSNGFTTRYLHNSSISVRAKQPVNKGDVIGKAGDKGQAVGAHIHFEVHKNNKPDDPRKYLSDDSRSITGSNCSPQGSVTINV